MYQELHFLPLKLLVLKSRLPYLLLKPLKTLILLLPRWTLDLSSLNHVAANSCVEKDSESASTGVERSADIECTCYSGGRGHGPCASRPLSWPSSLEEVDEACLLTICKMPGTVSIVSFNFPSLCEGGCFYLHFTDKEMG